MGKGKDLCDTLKTIRKAVADANGIEYVPVNAQTMMNAAELVRHVRRK